MAEELNTKATGPAVPIYQIQTSCNGWSDHSREEYEGARLSRRIVYAAPSPAAREAGDGVTLTDEQRHSLEFATTLLESRGYTGRAKDLRALLREAGSR